MKRVTVAVAKNTLPALLHQTEEGPVEIVRRGKPVAVIVSKEAYDRLQGKGKGVWAALEQFRSTHDLDMLDAASAWEGIRDLSPTGRRVRW